MAVLDGLFARVECSGFQLMAQPKRIAPLPLVNLLVLGAAYAALFTSMRTSAAYRAALVAGALVVAAVGYAALAPPARRWLRHPSSPFVRALLATSPWAALTFVVITEGLWWTQRPVALRAFALYALANWSVLWCAGDRARADDPWAAGPRRAATVIAAALGALALQGAAFGVTPYGCSVSAALGVVAALVFAVACFGSRSACLKAFAASLAAAVAAAGVEGAVRVLRIGHNVQEVDSREYARQFYTLTPPRSAFVNAPNTLDEFGPALIAINSRGIRGPELSDARADVLLIGDSMIEARQLPWEETLGPRLQRALTDRGVATRVVAHGMRGWSPLLEWNWYLKVGRQLHPRIVMLFFFWNDLWTAGSEAATFSAALDANGRPDHFDVPVDSNWIWYKHVRVIRLAADVLHRLSMDELRRAFASVTAGKAATGTLDDAGAERLARTMTKTPLARDQLEALLTKPESDLDPELKPLARTSLWPGLRPFDLWSDAQRSAASRTELELQRFAEDVASDGGRLVIVYVPNPLQVGSAECGVGRLFERVQTHVLLGPESGIQTWLHGVTSKHGIELLDPSASMRELDAARPAGDTAPLYLRADCHWAGRGHQFMASYIADWYQRAPRQEQSGGWYNRRFPR